MNFWWHLPSIHHEARLKLLLDMKLINAWQSSSKQSLKFNNDN